MEYAKRYFLEVKAIAEQIDLEVIEKMTSHIIEVKTARGRIFFLGVGGSAGNASHAVNDFRKLCDIDAYTPVDNISEITAKTNDEGFETIFDTYLKLCKFNKKDVAKKRNYIFFYFNISFYFYFSINILTNL